MSDNEFTDWFDAHDNELLVMECEDIARAAFFAGMKAAQQNAHPTASGESGDEHLAEYNKIREQAGLPKLGGG